MKKKIFTLLTLLLCAITSSWADDVYECYYNGTSVVNTNTYFSSENSLMNSNYKDANNNTISITFTNNGGDEFTSSKLTKLTSAKGVNFTVSANHTASVFVVAVTKDSESGNGIALKKQNGDNWDNVEKYTTNVPASKFTRYEASFSNLEAGTYRMERNSLENGAVYVKVVESVVGPTITQHPASGSYTTGSAIPAMHVAATTSGGTLYYMWYKCDDANKTNPVALTDWTDVTSYTPATSGYYFCRVKDDNGSTDSNVATITISAAVAPQVSISADPEGDIATNTTVTLTATITAGNPTPTLQWYKNTTAASTSGATSISGATNATYTPDTSTPGTTYYFAVGDNSQGTNPSNIVAVVVKDQVTTPTFTPNGAYFTESQEISITCITADASIKYSTDNGSTWTDYDGTALTFTETTTLMAKAVKDDWIDSETASATFTKVTLAPQTSISSATTWDWSQYGTTEINTANTPFYRSDILVANVSQYGFAAPAAAFGPADAMVLNGDRIVYNNNCCQVSTAKFNTTVPGTIIVEFNNTGGNRPYRYLTVNGVLTEYKSNSTDKVTSGAIAVAPGEVKIQGVLDPAADASDAGQVTFLRIYKITFTPTAAPATVSATLNATSGHTTFASPYDLSFENVEGLTAAYVVSDVSATNATLTKVTAVPAGTGVILKGTAGAELSIPVTTYTGGAITNELVGVLNNCTVKANSVYVISGGEFKLYTGTEMVAGKAYLPKPQSNDARSLSISFDDNGTTAISNVAGKASEEFGEFYDLQGRRVESPAKGLYIVNGKKVVIK